MYPRPQKTAPGLMKKGLGPGSVSVGFNVPWTSPTHLLWAGSLAVSGLQSVHVELGWFLRGKGLGLYWREGGEWAYAYYTPPIASITPCFHKYQLISMCCIIMLCIPMLSTFPSFLCLHCQFQGLLLLKECHEYCVYSNNNTITIAPCCIVATWIYTILVYTSLSVLTHYLDAWNFSLGSSLPTWKCKSLCGKTPICWAEKLMVKWKKWTLQTMKCVFLTLVIQTLYLTTHTEHCHSRKPANLLCVC